MLLNHLFTEADQAVIQIAREEMDRRRWLMCPPDNLEMPGNPYLYLPEYRFSQLTFKEFTDEEIRLQAGAASLPLVDEETVPTKADGDEESEKAQPMDEDDLDDHKSEEALPRRQGLDDDVSDKEPGEVILQPSDTEDLPPPSDYEELQPASDEELQVDGKLEPSADEKFQPCDGEEPESPEGEKPRSTDSGGLSSTSDSNDGTPISKAPLAPSPRNPAQRKASLKNNRARLSSNFGEEYSGPVKKETVGDGEPGLISRESRERTGSTDRSTHLQSAKGKEVDQRIVPSRGRVQPPASNTTIYGRSKHSRGGQNRQLPPMQHDRNSHLEVLVPDSDEGMKSSSDWNAGDVSDERDRRWTGGIATKPPALVRTVKQLGSHSFKVKPAKVKPLPLNFFKETRAHVPREHLEPPPPRQPPRRHTSSPISEPEEPDETHVSQLVDKKRTGQLSGTRSKRPRAESKTGANGTYRKAKWDKA